MMMRLITKLYSTSPFAPEDIINKLIPNGIWPIVTQLLTTIALFIIVHKLLYKPVRQMLDKRANFIKQNIDNSIRDQKFAQSQLDDAERRLLLAKQESQRIVSATQEDISNAREIALQATHEQVRRLKLQADDDIKAAQLQAREDIRQEMVNIAIEASERVLEREVNLDDHQKIVADFIKDRVH